MELENREKYFVLYVECSLNLGFSGTELKVFHERHKLEAFLRKKAGQTVKIVDIVKGRSLRRKINFDLREI